jgi:hypothetical protein
MRVALKWPNIATVGGGVVGKEPFKLSRTIWMAPHSHTYFFQLGALVNQTPGSVRVPRQVIQQDGLIVKEYWLAVLYRIIPSIFYNQNSVPTPLMFLPYLQTISGQIFQGIFGFPVVVFDDSGPYSFNKLSLFLFGVNIFQVSTKSMNNFTASIH